MRVWVGNRILLFDTNAFVRYHKAEVIFPAIVKPRINNQITTRELRVIGEKGENLGVMPLEKALTLAGPDTGLDLIEIAPQAVPPVARLQSYDKFRYEYDKAQKKERQALRGAESKRIQISARAAGHDLQIKVKQLEKFLNEGHPVEVFVRLRGREKYNRAWAEKKLNDFLKMITVEYKMLSAPRFMRGLSVQIVKK